MIVFRGSKAMRPSTKQACRFSQNTMAWSTFLLWTITSTLEGLWRPMVLCFRKSGLEEPKRVSGCKRFIGRSGIPTLRASTRLVWPVLWALRFSHTILAHGGTLRRLSLRLGKALGRRWHSIFMQGANKVRFVTWHTSRELWMWGLLCQWNCYICRDCACWCRSSVIRIHIWSSLWSWTMRLLAINPGCMEPSQQFVGCKNRLDLRWPIMVSKTWMIVRCGLLLHQLLANYSNRSRRPRRRACYEFECTVSCTTMILTSDSYLRKWGGVMMNHLRTWVTPSPLIVTSVTNSFSHLRLWPRMNNGSMVIVLPWGDFLLMEFAEHVGRIFTPEGGRWLTCTQGAQVAGIRFSDVRFLWQLNRHKLLMSVIELKAWQCIRLASEIVNTTRHAGRALQMREPEGWIWHVHRRMSVVICRQWKRLNSGRAMAYSRLGRVDAARRQGGNPIFKLRMWFTQFSRWKELSVMMWPIGMSILIGYRRQWRPIRSLSWSFSQAIGGQMTSLTMWQRPAVMCRSALTQLFRKAMAICMGLRFGFSSSEQDEWWGAMAAPRARHSRWLGGTKLKTLNMNAHNRYAHVSSRGDCHRCLYVKSCNV